MKKAEARKEFLSQRQALSPEDLQLKDQGILKGFKELDLEGIKLLHLFLPISTQKEVDTLAIAKWIKDFHPEIKLVLSKSNTLDHTLSHFIWEDKTVLEQNKWGISEPTGGVEVSAAELDMVLVPLLAFNEQGHRIGYGKGFYDRFLAECRPGVQKVGLSYFEPLTQIEDVNPHDIPLNVCITPNKIWYFA